MNEFDEYQAFVNGYDNYYSDIDSNYYDDIDYSDNSSDADYYDSSENEISMWQSSYDAINGTSDEDETSDDSEDTLDDGETESSVSSDDNARHYPMRHARRSSERRHNTRQKRQGHATTRHKHQRRPTGRGRDLEAPTHFGRQQPHPHKQVVPASARAKAARAKKAAA